MIGHAPSDVFDITMWGDGGARVVHGAEGDPCIAAFQADGVGRCVQPEAEAVALGRGRHVSAGSHHLADPVQRDTIRPAKNARQSELISATVE